MCAAPKVCAPGADFKTRWSIDTCRRKSIILGRHSVEDLLWRLITILWNLLGAFALSHIRSICFLLCGTFQKSSLSNRLGYSAPLCCGFVISRAALSVLRRCQFSHPSVDSGSLFCRLGGLVSRGIGVRQKTRLGPQFQRLLQAVEQNQCMVEKPYC